MERLEEVGIVNNKENNKEDNKKTNDENNKFDIEDIQHHLIVIMSKSVGSYRECMRMSWKLALRFYNFDRTDKAMNQFRFDALRNTILRTAFNADDLPPLPTSLDYYLDGKQEGKEDDFTDDGAFSFL